LQRRSALFSLEPTKFMPWETIRVMNPARNARKKLRSWTTADFQHSYRHRTKLKPQRKRSGLRLNPNILTDLLAGDIASKVSKSVMSSLTGSRKRKKPAKRRKRHNPHLALIGGNPRAKKSFWTLEGAPRQPKRKRKTSYWTASVAAPSTLKSIRRHKKKSKKSSGLSLNGGTMATQESSPR
jgi:hypothetical protein